MLFYNYTKDKYTKKESGYMLDEKICKLREELNNSIVNGKDYSVTYKISVELDELIDQYYMQNKKKKQKIKKVIKVV